MGECTRTLSIVASIATSCVLFGCSGPTERGWMGGTYQQARAGRHSLLAPPSPRTVRPLPRDVAEVQKGAIFVSRVHETTPVAESGIHEGDLIVSVEGRPVTSLASFRKTIDQMPPGTVIKVTTYRDGAFQDRPVVIGQERLGESGHGCAALGLFIDLAVDLLPDPSFNVFGLLGYQQWDHRADLCAPEYAFARQASHTEGMGPGRGWALYLGPARVSHRRDVTEQVPFLDTGSINARVD
jgi:membrane-associated protease RseP (regulator of RpoE activity)